MRARHRRGDKIVEREAKECGARAAGEAGAVEQAGRDGLQDASGGNAALQEPENAGVRDVECAGDQTTEQNIGPGFFHGFHGKTRRVRLLSTANCNPRMTSSDHSGVTAKSAVPSIASRTVSLYRAKLDRSGRTVRAAARVMRFPSSSHVSGS